MLSQLCSQSMLLSSISMQQGVESSINLLCMQDTVRAGRRGSRQQCVDLARQSLLQGKSVIIDRCNVEMQQRQDFLQLAQQLEIPVRKLSHFHLTFPSSRNPSPHVT